MKKFKRILALSLASAMVLAMAACSSKDDTTAGETATGGNEGGADSPGKAESASRDVGVEILLRPCAVCCFGMRRLVF